MENKLLFLLEEVFLLAHGDYYLPSRRLEEGEDRKQHPAKCVISVMAVG
jgi:hypothetical protein